MMKSHQLVNNAIIYYKNKLDKENAKLIYKLSKERSSLLKDMTNKINNYNKDYDLLENVILLLETYLLKDVLSIMLEYSDFERNHLFYWRTMTNSSYVKDSKLEFLICEGNGFICKQVANAPISQTIMFSKKSKYIKIVKNKKNRCHDFFSYENDIFSVSLYVN
jgi:hypothetical protein